jgi:hypothetical protein
MKITPQRVTGLLLTSITLSLIAIASIPVVLNQFEIALLDFLISVFTSAGIGGLIVYYRPANPTGWFIVVFTFLWYYLFDIDLIIRRTLQYSVLKGLLGLTYFGGVTELQSLFTAASDQQSLAALMISTLAIAALFNLLRYRIQGIIDRRFYRQKYDAEKALAAFADAAR